jgi:hypothetical protein
MPRLPRSPPLASQVCHREYLLILHEFGALPGEVHEQTALACRVALVRWRGPVVARLVRVHCRGICAVGAPPTADSLLHCHSADAYGEESVALCLAVRVTRVDESAVARASVRGSRPHRGGEVSDEAIHHPNLRRAGPY